MDGPRAKLREQFSYDVACQPGVIQVVINDENGSRCQFPVPLYISSIMLLIFLGFNPSRVNGG